MARVATGLGIRELAAAADVSPNTISRLERGEELKESTIAAIRAALEAAGVEFIAENGGGAGVRVMKAMTAAEDPIEAAQTIGKWIPRTLTISQRVFVSCGQFYAASTFLKELEDHRMRSGLRNPTDVEQIVRGYSHNSRSMAVVGLFSLLDRGNNKRPAGQGVVSLQRIYHQLKQPSVAGAFLDLWEKRDPAFHTAWGRTRANAQMWIDDFLTAYRGLDWASGGSISHLNNLRNHGLAHLLEQPMTESITTEELRVLMDRLSEMTEPLGNLCLKVPTRRVGIGDATDWTRRSLRFWRSITATGV